jgi:hypothetical protein
VTTFHFRRSAPAAGEAGLYRQIAMIDGFIFYH